MGEITIKTLGLKGVNTDKDPLELDPDELTQAQNATNERLGAVAGVVSRPGLVAFTVTPSEDGVILGGIGVLEPDASTGGTPTLFLGRGGASS